MNTVREALTLAGALTLMLTLGACSDSQGPSCSANPTGPGCPPMPPPTLAPAPTPTPTPTPAAPLISGLWDSEARRWHFRLEQQGTTIAGTLLGYGQVDYSNPEDPLLQVTGTINGSQVDFSADAFHLNFVGTVQAGGQRIIGTLHDCANRCRNYGEELVKR